MTMDKQKPKDKPDDKAGLSVSGHLVIRDKETGQELVKKRD
jgi:putative hemolysin